MPKREDRSVGDEPLEMKSAWLASIVTSSNDAVVGIGLDGFVESWNKAAEVLYGYAAEEMIGRSTTQLLPKGYADDEEAALIRDLKALRGAPPFETVRVRKDGTTVNISLSISPICDGSGVVQGVSHIARDSSAGPYPQRAAAHLAAIIDSSEDAIVSKTIDGVIQSWNTGAERLYGYAAEEVLARPMVDLLPKNLLSEEQTILEKVRCGERVQHLDTVRIHKDGRSIEVSLTISPIRSRSGEIIGVLHVARDIAEERQLKERLQVSQKMEALGRLAGGVAHDFNNLLTVIGGYGALLQASLKGNSVGEDMVDEVMGAAEKAAELTRQLLVFSRSQVVQLQVIDLNLEISKLRSMLGRLIGEDILIETGLAANLQKVKADPGQLAQILVNLAANARDAMPQGGKITIQTENWIVHDDPFHRELGFTPGRYARLLFTDTGQGMDAATRTRIFEPFFTTKEVGKGTGLGLATVYGIVKQSGGQISVYSEVGCGTTFAIYLPCTEEERGHEVAMQPKVSEGSETILLVEDEPSVRKLASSILQSNGYKVLTASNPEEALVQANRYANEIKLLVTDIVMPGSNGHELASQLSSQRPDLRVVFMSGYSEHAVLERVLSEPGATFLQKPFTPAQLLRAIREVLD